MSVDLQEYFGSEKLLSRHPAWIPGDRNSLRLSVPLDIDGVTIAGLDFCAYAMAELPEEEVVLQLQHKRSKGKSFPFCRIEWRPLAEHSNNGKGPTELKFLKFRATHIHPFDINYDFSKGTMRSQNISIARPYEKEPQTWEELLDLAAKEFRISNMDWVPSPPWQLRGTMQNG
jgi:hypothetical protein